MKTLGLTAFLTAGLLAFACGGDDATSSSNTTNPSTGSGNTTSSGGSGGTSSGTGGTSSSSSGSATGGMGSGGMGTGGGDPCASDPADDMCTACLKSMCCADVQACAADADCVCMVACFQGLPAGTSPQQAALQCSQQCNISVAAIPAPAIALVQCAGQNGPCSMSCMP